MSVCTHLSTVTNNYFFGLHPLLLMIWRIQCGVIIMWLIFSQILTNVTRCLDHEGEVWVSFVVSTNSDLFFASITGMHAVSYYIVRHYNSTRLYMPFFKTSEILSNFILHFNTLRLRQSGCHFPDDIFKCIFLNENVRISINIPLKFVPKGPINNFPALVR